MSKFFAAKYWFSDPVFLHGGKFWVALVVLCLLMALGIFGLVAQSRPGMLKKLYSKLGSWGLSMGLSGFVLFFFRQQNATILDWRIWFLLWLIVLVVWGFVIARYLLIRVPEIRKEQSERERKEKYLP